jgi:hypothetical protein
MSIKAGAYQVEPFTGRLLALILKIRMWRK